MAFGVFSWLRNQARAAVLGGVSDALSELAPDDKPADLDGLRKLVAAEPAKALPAATSATAETELEPGMNGKRRVKA